MDVQGRTIWQHAAGDTVRNLVDLCLRWDVILNGPGYCGPWPECEPLLRGDEVSERKLTDLRRFCEEMNENDLVVLRIGTNLIPAVGEIVGDYVHHDEFNDMDGWSNSHVRRIRWLWTSPEAPKQFDTYTLKLGDTTQRLDSPDVYSWLECLIIPDSIYDHEPVILPRLSSKESIDGISEHLFDKGVSSASILNLLSEIGEFVRVANWYKREETPSENETVSYLVVPLLRALGWTQQKMAIEWNRIDVALFCDLPRRMDNVSIVVEVKRMDHSCLSAFDQARNYALEAPRCKRLIVTDGLRYGVFVKSGDDSSQEDEDFSLHAYLNLTRLRQEYPVYECMGAKEALRVMSPEGE